MIIVVVGNPFISHLYRVLSIIVIIIIVAVVTIIIIVVIIVAIVVFVTTTIVIIAVVVVVENSFIPHPYHIHCCDRHLYHYCCDRFDRCCDSCCLILNLSPIHNIQLIIYIRID